MLVIDAVYNTFSFPKRHFICTVMFSLLYLGINIIYSVYVKVIYPPMPWNTPLSYFLALGAFAMAYSMHWLGWFCFERFKKNRIESKMGKSLYIGNANKDEQPHITLEEDIGEAESEVKIENSREETPHRRSV